MITPAWTPLRPHALQSKLWRTSARFCAVACGRGSGKTELARRRLARFLPIRKAWPDPMYAYCAPTRDQAKRIAWEKLKALIPSDWIREVSESGLVISTVFGSRLFLVGMDNPARIEGDQWDGIVIDESCDQKPGAYARSVRPALAHKRGWCWRIGVPKRWGPGASDFKQFWEGCASGELGPDHEAYAWPSSDILSPDEIESARRSLDVKDYEEQFGAVWQGTSGLVFYAFDPILNIRDTCVYRPDQPILVGSDFNVDPMAWVMLHRINGEYQIFDELWMRNTNTQAALSELHRRYGAHENGFLFFGDATARSRNTRASASDYAQIVNDTRFKRAKVFYPKSNPRRVDRFAACNAHLCNASGDRRVFIHPKCVNLIHDLGARAYQPFSREPDDDEDVGHITDAFGYVIHYLSPVMPTSFETPKVYAA